MNEMSVEWVKNNSKYEVSSKEHLLQLMSKGSLYDDSGSSPVDYWGSDYVQVADIDMETDSNISPIGRPADPFSGSYDGAQYAVTDWEYQDASEDSVGLFGHVSGSTIENVSLEGTWTLNGGSQCGFLVGACESLSSVYNITADLSTGSISSLGDNIGGLIGSASGSTIEGLTVKGSLSFISGGLSVGGVVGSLVSNSRLNYVRNMAQFTSSGISGETCAGACADVSNSDCTYVMNAIVGDVTGVGGSGGVFCTIQNTSTNAINHVVNSMIGSTSSTGKSGGICSTVQSDGNSVFSMNTLANYSSGSIGGTSSSGGIVGSIADGVEILNSVIAMNGTVGYAGTQSSVGSNNSIQVQIITGFGLNYTTSGADVELTALSGSFGMHSGFLLQYFPFLGSDGIGNIYNWEFVFANVPGSTQYNQYTHAVISSGDVCGPVEIQINVSDNPEEHIYFMNLSSNEVVTSPGLMISYSSGLVFDTSGSALYPLPPLVIANTSPFSVSLSWEEVDGSVGYRVDYGLTSIGSLDKSVTTESTSVSIMNLDASSQHTFQVYSSSDGTLFNLEPGVSGSVTTLANTASSYLLPRFLKDEVYDFSKFSLDKTEQVASIIHSLLGQDESVLVNVNGQTRELLVAGVSGSTIGVTDGDEYIAPFKTTSGSGQSLTIEGIYEGVLEYNESNDSIVIEGVEYVAGDTVIVGTTRITLSSV